MVHVGIFTVAHHAMLNRLRRSGLHLFATTQRSRRCREEREMAIVAAG